MGIPNPVVIKQFQLIMEEVDKLLKNTFEVRPYFSFKFARSGLLKF
ncbi:hypothetical protein RchiOBHm_Chr5g0004771 [Rosa chinensis]|uniref:Uncharacterized protein n=1 Tax=Rosa chinensis TaxID=74649 RepID=A0A2P6Q343_ROSCH|nr:hypothetical protein RchiOBHm_Chr5g0004771 [Rosa chinensis]